MNRANFQKEIYLIYYIKYGFLLFLFSLSLIKVFGTFMQIAESKRKAAIINIVICLILLFRQNFHRLVGQRIIFLLIHIRLPCKVTQISNRILRSKKYRKMYFTISLVFGAVIFGNGLVLSAGRDFPSGNKQYISILC